MRQTILFAILGFLLCSCTADRLTSQTVRCALDSYQGKQPFSSNALNTRAGLIAIAHDRKRIDIWHGCGEPGKSELTTQIYSPTYMHFSPSGKYLFVGANTPLEIFDVPTLQSIAWLKDCSGPVEISPDERLVLFPCHSGIRFFDLKGGRLLPGPGFSPDGHATVSMATNARFDTLAIGTGSDTILLAAIDRHDGAPSLRRLARLGDRPDPGVWISGLAFSSRSEELVSVSRNGRVDVWDTTSRSVKRSWQTKLRWVFTATFYDGAGTAAIFGTLTPSGFEQDAGQIIDTRMGAMRLVETPSNLQWSSYVPRLHALVVTGSWRGPRLEPADVNVQ